MLRACLNDQASTMVQKAEEERASVCKMRKGAGCAMAKWKLCKGNLRRLGFGAVHSHACIICPVSLASMLPLSSELLRHFDPLATTPFLERKRPGEKPCLEYLISLKQSKQTLTFEVCRIQSKVVKISLTLSSSPSVPPQLCL